MYPFLNGLLKDIINDALSGCNLADLIADGACFKQNLAKMWHHQLQQNIKLLNEKK